MKGSLKGHRACAETGVRFARQVKWMAATAASGFYRPTFKNSHTTSNRHIICAVTDIHLFILLAEN